jgi:hypothetical protein
MVCATDYLCKDCLAEGDFPGCSNLEDCGKSICEDCSFAIDKEKIPNYEYNNSGTYFYDAKQTTANVCLECYNVLTGECHVCETTSDSVSKCKWCGLPMCDDCCSDSLCWDCYCKSDFFKENIIRMLKCTTLRDVMSEIDDCNNHYQNSKDQNSKDQNSNNQNSNGQNSDGVTEAHEPHHQSTAL